MQGHFLQLRESAYFLMFEDSLMKLDINFRAYAVSVVQCYIRFIKKNRLKNSACVSGFLRQNYFGYLHVKM
jgi:hypothetical protein